MPHLGEILSIVCALLWATAVMFFRVSMRRAVEPFALNIFKNLVALVCLLLTLPFISGVFEGIGLQELLVLSVSGILGITMADTLFLSALHRLGASRNAILDCLYSPFVIVLSVIALGERILPWQGVGFAMVLVGVLVTVFDPVVKTQQLPDGSLETVMDDDVATRRNRLLGMGQGALSMFLMALGIVLAKPVLETTSTVGAATIRIAVSLVAAVVWLGLKGRLRTCANGFTRELPYGTMAIGGFLGTYLALIVWMAGYKYTTASTAAVLNQTSVFFIIFMAGYVLKESISARRVVGAIIGFAGVAVIFLTG
ncbi:MAG: DMT family transporter [Verrucomicrobiota bacterium]|nr:DMT family transporter [Verrucomicrobiota bacterium]